MEPEPTYQDLYSALRTCCILALNDAETGYQNNAITRIERFLEDLEKVAPNGSLPENTLHAE